MAAKARNAKSTEPKVAEKQQGTEATDWANQVINHLMDTQKRWIEITAQQNALILKSIEEGANFYRNAPTPELGGLGATGLRRFC